MSLLGKGRRAAVVAVQPARAREVLVEAAGRGDVQAECLYLDQMQVIGSVNPYKHVLTVPDAWKVLEIIFVCKPRVADVRVANVGLGKRRRVADADLEILHASWVIKIPHNTHRVDRALGNQVQAPPRRVVLIA